MTGSKERPKPGNMSRTRPSTRLQRWLDANGFTSAQLEKEIGMSRPSMTRIRGGRDVRRRTMIRILAGCRALANRKVHMEEIFDLEPEDSMS